MLVTSVKFLSLYYFVAVILSLFTSQYKQNAVMPR